MKKIMCPICGDNTQPFNNDSNYCSNCNSVIDLDLINKTNKIKVLKNKTLIYVINREFNKAITFLTDTYNNLLLEYYKAYCYISLNKEYDINNLYNEQLEYTEEELDILINHIFENYDSLKEINIIYFIKKTNNENKYLTILNNINNHNQDKVYEKDFREILFHKTFVPTINTYNSRKREGFSFLLIGFIFNIINILIGFILLFQIIKCNIKIVYPLMILLNYIPSIIIVVGASKLILKNKNLFISILLFIVTIYINTFGFTLITQGLSLTLFMDHFLSLFTSPFIFIFELVKSMDWTGVEYEM